MLGPEIGKGEQSGKARSVAFRHIKRGGEKKKKKACLEHKKRRWKKPVT